MTDENKKEMTELKLYNGRIATLDNKILEEYVKILYVKTIESGAFPKKEIYKYKPAEANAYVLGIGKIKEINTSLALPAENKWEYPVLYLKIKE